MKKIALFFSLIMLLAGLTVVFVHANNIEEDNSFAIENPFFIEEDNVSYSVDHLSVSLSDDKEKGKYIVEVEITVSSEDEYEIVTPLMVAYDSDFQNKLDYGNVISDGDSISGIYYSDNVPETMCVKMPIVAKVTNDVIIADKDTDFLVLKYTEDEFPVFPRLLEIESQGISVQCLFNDCSRNDEGELIEGYYTFIKPENFIINDTYDVTILGSYDNCSPVIAEIPIN